MSHSRIRRAIEKYAEAYAELQCLQETESWIPGGDQKTGSIGEYYAFIYLASVHGENNLRYGSHSEKGWDIEVLPNCGRIQVKTVSAFSRTRTISPIHKGCSELYLLYLNRQLQPEGFWIVSDVEIFGDRHKIEGAKCRIPGSDHTGSRSIPFGDNRIHDLRAALRGLGDA